MDAAVPYHIGVYCEHSGVGPAGASWLGSIELLAFAVAAVWCGRLIALLPRPLLPGREQRRIGSQ